MKICARALNHSFLCVLWRLSLTAQEVVLAILSKVAGEAGQPLLLPQRSIHQVLCSLHGPLLQ